MKSYFTTASCMKTAGFPGRRISHLVLQQQFQCQNQRRSPSGHYLQQAFTLQLLLASGTSALEEDLNVSFPHPIPTLKLYIERDVY